ncbi:Alpha-1A adrenergic receptor [Holothuria leucospilota]|uniref:Alpha-1A adrenergic receptor n=1 Tax=Holothuria leucospilota TaxID=206669 RepID=A0A9Q1H5S1_HOLLE|nr:Alpha-1A adrenergic receptor [Holothuria leucospilota]
MALRADNLAISIFLVIISVIGVPGNVLVLKVYCRRARKLSTYVFISFMAVSDLFLCVLSPLHTAFILVTDPGKKQVLCNAGIFISAVCRILSFLTSAVVAFDRYVAVSWLNTKRLSVPTSLILSMTCAVCSVILSIPAFFVVSVSLEEYDFISCKRRSDFHPFVQIGVIIAYSTIFTSAVVTITCYALAWRSIRNQRIINNLSLQVPTNTGSNNFALVDVRYTIEGKKLTNMSPNVETPSIPFLNTNQNTKGSRPIEGKLASNDHEFEVGRYKASKIDLSEESTSKSNPVIPNIPLMLPESTDVPKNKKSPQNLLEEDQNRGIPGSRCAPTHGNKDVKKSPALTASTARTKRPKLTVILQRRITIMLFLIAAIQLTTMPIGMLARSVPDSKLRDVKYTSEVLFVIIRVAEYLGFINNAVNPFIYNLFDKRFRKECFKTFTCVSAAGR